MSPGDQDVSGERRDVDPASEPAPDRQPPEPPAAPPEPPAEPPAPPVEPPAPPVEPPAPTIEQPILDADRPEPAAPERTEQAGEAALEAPPVEQPAAPEPVAAEPGPDQSPLEAPVPGDVTGDRLAAIEARLEQLGAINTQLERLVEAERLAARDRALADRLYADVQGLRRGELAEAQAPLLRDLIRLTDQIARLTDVSDAADDLQLVEGQLLEVLARAGVERELPEVGDPFDPARHNGVARVPTDDPDRARLVAAVVRPGFVRGTAVLRPADVEVHHFQQPKE